MKIIDLLENINLEPFPTEEDYALIPFPEFSCLDWFDEMMEEIEIELGLKETLQ